MKVNFDKKVKEFFRISLFAIMSLIIIMFLTLTSHQMQGDNPIKKLGFNNGLADNLATKTSSSKVEIIASGDLTETVHWRVEKDKLTGVGTLVISGTGDMPDYTTSKVASIPYYSYKSSYSKLIIEDGITRVGDCCFYSISTIKTVQFGKDVASIGTYGFCNSGLSGKVVIPGNVKVIGSSSFYGAANTFTEVVLEEGVETVLSGAFTYDYSMKSISIPSTVTVFNSDDINTCTALEQINIAEGNPVFFIEDGIMYKITSDATVQLFMYPRNKVGDEFVIPATVRGYKVNSIGTYAFYCVSKLKKVTIPSTITTTITGDRNFYYSSSLEEIIFEKGVKVSSTHMLDGCAKLKKIELYDDTIVGNWFYLNGCSSIEYVYVPESSTGMLQYAFQQPLLSEVYYNAANAIYYQPNSSKVIKYKLTIGEKVNYLRGTEINKGSLNGTGFQTVLKNASDIIFVGENQITISKGVFEDRCEPLNQLVGTVWVDSQGIVYMYDKATNTASVAYVPFGIESATIPESIAPETGVTCTVNSINSYAFKLAQDLKSVQFDNPEAIENISAYGMAYCNNLSSINGKTTVEEATDLFANANVGYKAFYCTALGSLSGEIIDYDSINGQKNVIAKKENANPLIISVTDDKGTLWNGNDELGKYELLTGESAQVELSVSSSDDVGSNIYRTYFEFSELDGSLSIAPGDVATINKTKISCYATDVPNIVYVDFTPTAGTTVSSVLSVVYPTPTSGGGCLKVWGTILSPEEAEANSGKIIDYHTEKDSSGENYLSDAIQIEWGTKSDDFVVTKAVSGTANITLYGNEDGSFTPSNNITYTIKHTRASTETNSVGKDYVKSVEFYDVMDFTEASQDGPAGWKDEIVQKIKDGKAKYSGGYFYVDDEKVASISISGTTFQTARLYYDEDIDDVVIYWRVYNSSTTSEISTTTATLNILSNAIAIKPDSIGNPPDKSFSYKNNIKTVTHYNYGEDKQSEASLVREFKLVKGNINASITQSNSNGYFGESNTYTLRVYNTGSLPYYGEEDVEYTEQLNNETGKYIYITPSNIEKMFADEYGKDLIVKINKAVIAERSAVTSFDGSTAYITGANSNVQSKTENLVICWNDEKTALQVKREDGTVIPVTTSLEDTLNSIGYSVGFDTAFIPIWIVNPDGDDKPILMSNESKYYYVYANYKDTFMFMDSNAVYDTEGAYPTSTIGSYVYSYMYKSNYKYYISRPGTYFNIKRDLYISRQGVLHSTGETLQNQFDIKLGDILEYNIDLEHYGKGAYNDLPIVDYIYGTQVLLAPVNENPQLADKNLSTIDVDGIIYYKLSKAGVYHNVVVGVNENAEYMIADTVEVVAVNEEEEIVEGETTYKYLGLKTRIKWYYPQSNAEPFYRDISYYTFIDEEQLKTTTISAGAISYANDKTNDRIFTSMLGGLGSLMNFEKTIVEKDENGNYKDVEGGYSTISNGEDVTYCLKFNNINEYELSLVGRNVYDILPDTKECFEWKKNENVKISYEDTKGAEVKNLDNWYIDDSRYGIQSAGTYYLRFADDASIKLDSNAEFKIYVTLKYPENNEGSNLWSEYCEAVGGERIQNTLCVYEIPSVVEHNLKASGRGFIQKGVYATYRYKNSSGSIFTETERRIYYNNKDSNNRAVSYYTVIYNEGYTRLYLNDIYDQLPKGFKYIKMIDSATNIKFTSVDSITTPSKNPFSTINADEEEVKYVNAIVTADVDDNIIKFTALQSAGSNPIEYDEDLKKCYLKHGEAIVFGYICDIGETQETEDVAINTIGMEYYDYLDTGVTASGTEVGAEGKITENYYEQNDGTKILRTTEELSDDYLFAKYGKKDGQWLISNNTISRGGIIPGVTNYTVSYCNSGSNIEYKYISAVSPFATINWQSRLHNAGTNAITDYTFTDVLPTNFSLTGNVTMKIYDGKSETALETFNLFSVVSASHTGDVTIKSNGKEYVIPEDGTPVKVKLSDGTETSVSMSHKDVMVTSGYDTIKTMTIVFENPIFSIPENGGYADISLSTVNMSGIYRYTVYTNQSDLKPNRQEFTNVSQGSVVYDGEGVEESVLNSSLVNVSPLSSSTTSTKAVQEINDSTNKTNSDSSKRYIILGRNDNQFKYTLQVYNDTGGRMSKIILIDSLPQVGDHNPFYESAPRNSEFKVNLCSNPEFNFVFVDDNGNETIVSSDSYRIEYSSKTEFIAEDWSGASSWNEWTTEVNPSDVRSIRVVYLSDVGIPNKTTIKFSFNAEAENGLSLSPGVTAWNSFGYHFSLKDYSYELEAMPYAIGVKTADVPNITKTLVDLMGEKYNAEENTSFKFMIYEGDYVLADYNEQQLKQYLNFNGRKFTDFELTVNTGRSSSDKIKLLLEKWNWINGEKYTVVEVTDNVNYTLDKWNNRNIGYVTFTYNPDTSYTLNCCNKYVRWSLDVLKVSSIDESKHLKGAIFGLYGKQKTAENQDKTYIDVDGNVWYLIKSETTNSDGELTFENLANESYYLVELQPPNGYDISFTPALVSYNEMSTGITVKDQKRDLVVYFHENFDGNSDEKTNDLFRTYYEEYKKTEYSLTSDNKVEVFYAIPDRGDDYVFGGWYYDADFTKNNDNMKWNTDIYDGAGGVTEYHIYAHWIEVGTVDKDTKDDKVTDSNVYGGFNLFGTQIRDAKLDPNYDYGDGYYSDSTKQTGLRFVTSVREGLLADVNVLFDGKEYGNYKDENLQYGYLFATKANADKFREHYGIAESDYELKYKSDNTNGENTNSLYKYVSNIECTSSIGKYNNVTSIVDHRNFNNYRIYSTIISYSNEANKDSKLIARSYLRYVDANGLLRIFYNDYDGNSSIYNGCCTTFNEVSEGVSKIINAG